MTQGRIYRERKSSASWQQADRLSNVTGTSPPGYKFYEAFDGLLALDGRSETFLIARRHQVSTIWYGGSTMGRTLSTAGVTVLAALLSWSGLAAAQRVEFDEVLIQRNGRTLERVAFPDETSESISFIFNLPNPPQNFQPGTVVLIEPVGQPAGSGVPCLGGAFLCSDAIQLSPSPFFNTQILVNFFSDPTGIPGGFMVEETGFLQDVTDFFLIDPTKPAPFEVFIGSDLAPVRTPEPGTLLLAGTGIAALALWRRSRQRKHTHRG